MKQKHGGGNKKSATLQERLEILCARYYSITIISTPHGYRVHCEDEADMDTLNSEMHAELDKAVKELTPEV